MDTLRLTMDKLRLAMETFHIVRRSRRIGSSVSQWTSCVSQWTSCKYGQVAYHNGHVASHSGQVPNMDTLRLPMDTLRHLQSARLRERVGRVVRDGTRLFCARPMSLHAWVRECDGAALRGVGNAPVDMFVQWRAKAPDAAFAVREAARARGTRC